MRAIVKEDPGPGAALRQVDEPRITQPDQVIVKPLAASICGTDYHVYSWDAWSAHRIKGPFPQTMGHEFAGTVVECGSGVRNFKVGDYVSGESHWFCGKCYQCLRGQQHVCQNTRILGVDVHGCFADFVVIPEASAWKNHPELPPKIACIQDPLGNAIHATMAGEIAVQTVAVLGCGPIGIFAVAVAKAVGASLVIATDTKPYRLDLARKLGADDAYDVAEGGLEALIADRTKGVGVDVVLEMSGAPAAIQQAMRIVRPGGRVSLMGIPTRTIELDIADDMIFKGLDIKCIVGRRIYDTWETMRPLLDSGKLDVSAAITHELPMEELDKGMALMRDGLCGKVVFRM